MKVKGAWLARTIKREREGFICVISMLMKIIKFLMWWYIYISYDQIASLCICCLNLIIGAKWSYSGETQGERGETLGKLINQQIWKYIQSKQ